MPLMDIYWIKYLLVVKYFLKILFSRLEVTVELSKLTIHLGIRQKRNCVCVLLYIFLYVQVTDFNVYVTVIYIC